LLKIPPTATTPITPGGTVTGIQVQEANTLHFYKTNNPAAFDYLKLLFSASLTHRNPLTLELEKGAAESWSVDTARSTVTFKLKTGLKWSDGQPLTAADYVWTYQQASKPENGWPYANTVGIDSYTAPDPLTLIIKLKNYTFDITIRADVIEPLPRHIWEKLDWNDATKNPEINKPSVVSGPWLLKS
jgi:peptide/nickel transport system substrate-binding protein